MLKVINMFYIISNVSAVNLSENNTSLFGAILTISLTSLTIISVINSSNRSYYDIKFSNIISFSNFPYKFNTLLILSFVNISLSFAALSLNSSIILIFLFLTTILVVLVYSLGFFKYLFRDEMKRNFLLKNKTLELNGEEIISRIFNYLNDNVDNIILTEFEEIKNIIKTIKEKNQNKLDNKFEKTIKHNEDKLINTIIKKKNYVYLYQEYLSEQNQNNNLYVTLIFDSFRIYSLASYKDFIIERLIDKIKDVSKSEDIIEVEKITILFNVISNTMKNNYLTSFEKKNVINHMIRAIFRISNEIEFTHNIKTLSALYKDLVLYNENYDTSIIFIEIIVNNLKKYPLVINSEYLIKIITTIYFQTMLYLKHDTVTNDFHRNKVFELLKFKFDNIYGESFSLIDIFRINLNDVIVNFKHYDYKVYLDPDFLQQYPPLGSVYGLTYSTKYVINNFFESLLSILYIDNYTDLLDFDLISKEEQLLIYKEYVSYFSSWDNYREEKLKGRDKLNYFLEISNQPLKKPNYWQNSLFEEAKEKYYTLLQEGIVEPETIYYVGQDTIMEEMFTEEENRKFNKISIDNSKLFAANETIDSTVSDKVVYNFGINNKNEFKDAVFYSQIDERFIYNVQHFIIVKYLREVDIDLNDLTTEDFVKILEDNNYNLISNNAGMILLNKHLIVENRKELDILKNYMSTEKPLHGPRIVALNRDAFSYKIDAIVIIRHKLTEEEIVEYMYDKLRAGATDYLINGMYFNYDRAFAIVKENFYRDEVEVHFRVIRGENPGIFINIK